jgi:hypothetical protein
MNGAVSRSTGRERGRLGDRKRWNALPRREPMEGRELLSGLLVALQATRTPADRVWPSWSAGSGSRIPSGSLMSSLPEWTCRWSLRANAEDCNP